MKKIFKVFIGIAFILALLIISFATYYYFEGKKISAFYDKWENADYFNKSYSQHWGHFPLRYKNYNCPNYQIERIERAFDILEYNTQLSFIELSEFDNQYGYNPYIEEDIAIFCENVTEFLNGKWDGEPLGKSQIAVFSDDKSIISYAELTFYYVDDYFFIHRCQTYPSIEMHEILHIFGFYHSDDEDSIMHPAIKRCSELSWKEINQLNRIYG